MKTFIALCFSFVALTTFSVHAELAPYWMVAGYYGSGIGFSGKSNSLTYYFKVKIDVDGKVTGRVSYVGSMGGKWVDGVTNTSRSHLEGRPRYAGNQIISHFAIRFIGGAILQVTLKSEIPTYQYDSNIVSSDPNSDYSYFTGGRIFGVGRMSGCPNKTFRGAGSGEVFNSYYGPLLLPDQYYNPAIGL